MQHHLDPRIVAHDIKRTARLSELGWTGCRIVWSEFKKLKIEDRKQKVAEIIQFLKLTVQ